MSKLSDRLGVHSKCDWKTLAAQFIKFGMVGVSNTAVSLGIYYLFLWINSNLYMVGTVFGTALSIVNAFFWNDRFVFRSNQRDIGSILKRLGKTFVSYGGTSMLSIVLLWTEVNLFHMSKEIAPLVNLIITIPLNFLINKLWTFREKGN